MAHRGLMLVTAATSRIISGTVLKAAAIGEVGRFVLTDQPSAAERLDQLAQEVALINGAEVEVRILDLRDTEAVDQLCRGLEPCNRLVLGAATESSVTTSPVFPDSGCRRSRR